MADPKEGTASTATHGPGAPTSGGSSPDVQVISLAEHQRVIEEERRRRSGQESAHQRQMAELKAQLAEVNAKLDGRTPSVSLPEELVARLNSGDESDARAAMAEALSSVHKWTTHLATTAAREKELAAKQREIDARLEQLQTEGVDVTKLRDITSLDAIETSVDRYQLEKRIEDQDEKIASMSKNTQTVEDAVTLERNRNGSTQTTTSTGTAPRPTGTIQQQIEFLEQQLKQAKARHDGGKVMSLNRDLARLKQAAAA